MPIFSMIINRLYILVIMGIFIFIPCNPVFSSDSVSVMGEVYRGEDRGIDSLEQELKSPQEIRNAPVIEIAQDTLKSQRAAMSDDSVPNQIGFARQIESLSELSLFKQLLNWYKIQDGGYSATIIISSPGAKALRVGIIVNKLPQETEFRFFELENETSDLFPVLVTGEQINFLLQVNKTADPDHPDSQTYWSPTVPGDNIGIEIYIPPDIEPENVEMAIPFLSHIFASPFISNSESSIMKSYGDSDPCHNDATCYSSWQSMRKAVAKMVYTQSGYSYLCTGTLLNDTDPNTDKPYFITANHCISTQTVASSLETHWFFESAWCNASTRNANYSIKSGGATLLWTKGRTTSSLDSNQDVSFLELNNSPPAGVFYSGWNASIEPGTVTGIHHPAGDWKKISFGDQGGYYQCYDTYGDSFNCNPSSTGSFLEVVWSDGGTEGGSSGSGIFQNYSYLVGVLFGGSGGPCGGTDKYSKFGAAYSAGNLSQWLNPAPCTYSISPSSGSFTSGGGSKSVSVTASSSSCSWTTSENLSWVSISPTSGTGSRSVTVSVNPNTGSARSGSGTIAGYPYNISQTGTTLQTAFILTRTTPNRTITSGSDEKVYGTSTPNEIILESGAKAELINFLGQNTIEIQSISDLFTVSRSGAVVTFEGSDETVLKIPATKGPQTITFSDRAPLTLSIYQGQVMLDDQEITLTPASINR
nr:BACON domain-containing protein [Desulfobulbaceae bacterium]